MAGSPCRAPADDGVPPGDAGQPPIVYDRASQTASEYLAGFGERPVGRQHAPPQCGDKAGSPGALPREEEQQKPTEVARALEARVMEARALEVGTPETLEHGAPETQEQGTPEALEHGTPKILEQGTPETLEQRTPEALEQGTPKTLEQGMPEALEHGEHNQTQSRTTKTADDNYAQVV